MGWANCGKDSKGRRIGYAVSANCDHHGCKTRIDRGLAYACGGMHGNTETCEGYFCGDHRVYAYIPSLEEYADVCKACEAVLIDAKADEYGRVLNNIVEELADVDRTDPAAMAEAIDTVLTDVFATLIMWEEGDDLPIDPRYMTPSQVEKYQKLALFLDKMREGRAEALAQEAAHVGT